MQALISVDTALEQPRLPARTGRGTRSAHDRPGLIQGFVEATAERRAREVGLRALDVRPGERALELGCGTGRALTDIARRTGSSGRSVGLDPSLGMLRRARRRLERAHLAADLVCADAALLPLDADWGDAVFMSFVLELFDTPAIPRVLAEARRVLRPGGRLCVVGLSRAGGPSRARSVFGWAHGRLPGALDYRPILVRRAVAGAGFAVERVRHDTLLRLPVEIVAARLARAE